MEFTNQCRALKPNGATCQAKARKNSPFCFFHDPNCYGQRRSAQRTGGRNRAKEIRVLPQDTPSRHLSSNDQISALIDDMVNSVLKGELDPSIVREVTRLLAVRLRLREVSGENNSTFARIAEILQEGRRRAAEAHRIEQATQKPSVSE